MKKLAHRMWAKALAMILCIISGIGGAGCVIGLLLYQEIPSENIILDEFYENIAANYSALLLDHMDADHPEQTLGGLDETTGMRYAVICSDVDPAVLSVRGELDDPSIYLYGDSAIADSYRYIFRGGSVGENAHYEYDATSFLQAVFNAGYTWEEDSIQVEEIEYFVFSAETGIFYTKTESGYYPISHIGIRVREEGSLFEETEIAYHIEQTGANSWSYLDDYGNELDAAEYDSWLSVSLGNYYCDLTLLSEEYGNDMNLSDIFIIVRVTERAALNPVYEPQTGWFEDGLYYHVKPETMLQYYWVLSYVDEADAADDLFSEARTLASFIMGFKKVAVGLEILFLAVFIASFAFLMAAAGHRREDDEIHLRIWDRIPFGIYLVAVCLIVIAGVGGFYIAAELIDRYIAGMLALMIEDIALMEYFVLAFLMSISVRIKARCFWRNTVLYRLSKLGKRLFGRIKDRWSAVHQAIREHTSIFWKTVLCLLAAYIVEFIALMLFAEGMYFEGILCWFVIFAAIRSGIIIWAVLQMARLQKGGGRIAAGDLSTPIDTHEMFWEFKKHAENINKVGDGIALAVEKQMKSERFKTELITNVSHDIKTPLTSIINYVDLIKKEEITDPKLLEYIEVLERQSARLKKLIEDLMEASKASTGNLSVNLEKCDAAVLLGQAVGEFEERAAAVGLELITTTPQQPVQILADGRHLWRVFDNLLNNICKYAQPQTRVYISLEQQNMMAVLIFKNISKYQLNISSEELMERFVRGDSSRNTEGSGLGLSIAQSLTNLMNGTMELQVDGDLFKVILRFPAV